MWRKCTICGKYKPLWSFYRCKNKPLGIQYSCKVCVNKSQQAKNIDRKRGRPIGHKLSEKTKAQISKSKMGTKHKEETKDKISESLIKYFRYKWPVSKDIKRVYRNNPEAMEWICEYADKIDEDTNILTTKRHSSINKSREFTMGENYVYVKDESISQETMLLVKEHCIQNGLDVEEFIDEVLGG